MFAKTIIDSDKFINMPFSAQALYFHLAMQADDDGFINNHQRVRRTINATEEDMQLLIANQFILPFESGIIVIKHWRIHNYIQSDRYKKTIHQEEKSLIEIGENREYYLLNDECIQDVYKTDTQNRLDKISIGKVSIGESNARAKNNLYGTFQNVLLSDEEVAALRSVYADYEERINRLSVYIKSTGKAYDSHYATIIKWANEDNSSDTSNKADNSENKLNEFEKSQLQNRMSKEPAEIGDVLNDIINRIK